MFANMKIGTRLALAFTALTLLSVAKAAQEAAEGGEAVKATVAAMKQIARDGRWEASAIGPNVDEALENGSVDLVR